MGATLVAITCSIWPPQPSVVARSEYRWKPLEPCSPRRQRMRWRQDRTPAAGATANCSRDWVVPSDAARAAPSLWRSTQPATDAPSQWRVSDGCTRAERVTARRRSAARVNGSCMRRLRYGLAPGRPGLHVWGWCPGTAGTECVHAHAIAMAMSTMPPAPSQWRKGSVGCVRPPVVGGQSVLYAS